ncbi:MAG: carbohydrate ABC transporter permease [Chloroflexi bacterium]|jgi:multiple sugar transport system permease protein|nr:carbohydrate ABC transporter permease [Chloroflexota bacterium]
MQMQTRYSTLPWQSRKLRDRIWLSGVLIWVSLGSLMFMFPLFWMLSTSLKTNEQVYTVPTVWIPNPIAWENYPTALGRMPFWLFVRNSCITSFVPVIGALLSASLVAYSFSRLRWPGRDFWFMVLIATMMLPGQVTMIPVYVLYSKLGWINTFFPLIVPWFFGGAFYVFMLRQFFTGIPMDLSEAALMDGCSHLRIWWSLILPLSKPALATVAVFTFLGTWNDFFGPLLYLTNQRLFTLQVGLQYFREQHGVYWQELMAASLVVLMPTLVIFFIGQKFFVQGITLTGLKG